MTRTDKTYSKVMPDLGSVRGQRNDFDLVVMAVSQ